MSVRVSAVLKFWTRSGVRSVLRLCSLVSNLACRHQVDRRATVHSAASTPVVLLLVSYSSLHSFLIHTTGAKHVGSATVHSAASTPVVLLPVSYSSLHSFLIHTIGTKHVGSATVLHPVPLWSFAGFSRWCQPSVVKVCIKRHKGSNPYHQEILCGENAAEKLLVKVCHMGG
ncbi:uncharacterized protein [Zea mays]|uniref:uncharacterized protein n=1 Tax=Zea mays TaxID=4577 RepID=UPI00165243C8|nr:uncharacterized protein LOC118476237 [Zea mays]